MTVSPSSGTPLSRSLAARVESALRRILGAMREFTTVDTFEITGRGTAHTVHVGDTPPNVGERVVLDSTECVVDGVMLPALNGLTALVVTPVQVTKTPIPECPPGDRSCVRGGVWDLCQRHLAEFEAWRATKESAL